MFKPTDQSNHVRRLSGTEATTADLKYGARTLKISPHCSHLATGDRQGTLRIYDLISMESIYTIEGIFSCS